MSRREGREERKKERKKLKEFGAALQRNGMTTVGIVRDQKNTLLLAQTA
ncbi:hypothetical protein [Nostoc sp.]